MNHYPHHIGDFAKDTLGFNQGAVGAYRLLMDAYYANEEAPSVEEVYVIGRATTQAERKNVDKALTKFELREGRYYHKRVEEEITAYRGRADSARENGKKGGRKPTDNRSGSVRDNPQGTGEAAQEGTQSEPSRKLASSHKPENPNLPIKQRYGDRDIPDSAASLGAAALEKLKTEPLSLAESRIDSADGTPAAVLSSICLANGVSPVTPFHPLVVEWARDGITVNQLKDAIARARLKKPSPMKIPPAYLDPILRDNHKPVDNLWKTDDQACVRFGESLGLRARSGEDFHNYRKRIADHLHTEARSQVA